jgi:putative transposase
VSECRAIVQELKARGLSERLACALVQLARSSVRDRPQPPASAEETLQADVLSLAQRHRRDGYRRITALLRRQGRPVNAKRIYRLWRGAGLALPRKRPRRRPKRHMAGVPQRAARPHHVWTDDFLCDRTEAGHALKILIVLDAYTREHLAIRVERRLAAGEVIATLALLFAQHGAPEYVRSDHGPELIAQALQTWLAQRGSQTVYITPGHPWENGYAERFIGKLRDEGLNEEIFRSIEEARVVIASWRWAYNHRRPHSSLGYQTPVERALQAGGDAPSALDSGTPNATEACQGHRLNFSLDQF